MIEVTKETTKVEGDIFTISKELIYLGNCLKGCSINKFTKTMILAAIDTMKDIIKDGEEHHAADNSDN